jgi:hypothetical protein
MGLGGDLPHAPPAERLTVSARPVESGLEAREDLASWRRGPVRVVVVTAALAFSGYVFSWGDVEEESRIVAAIAGGIVFALFTVTVGGFWWAIRALVGRGRPFGRTAFNYGLVATVFVLGILGADEFLG